MNEKLNKIYQYLSSQNVANLPPDYAGFETLMQDDAKAQKIHQYLLSQNIANVDADFNAFSDYVGIKKKVSALDLVSQGESVFSQFGKKQEPSLVQPQPSVLNNIRKQYPAFNAMGDVVLKADPNFTREKTGVGDIEFFSPFQKEVTYGNGFVVKHPQEGKYGIVYNPKTEDEQSIMLDMLHGMKEADPKYAQIRDEFKTAMLSNHKEDLDADWSAYVKDNPENDGKEQFIENWIDGHIRGLMFQGTSDDYKKHNYWEEERAFFLKDPKVKESFNKLITHLKSPQPQETPDMAIQQFLSKSTRPQNPFIEAAESTGVSRTQRPIHIPTLGDYLNKKGVKPTDLGLSENVNQSRLLRDGEPEAFDAIIKRKGLEPAKPSYFWGLGKEIHHMYSGIMRDVDEADKTLASVLGTKYKPFFKNIADWIDYRAQDIPNMPEDHFGRLLTGSTGVGKFLIENSLTPEFKLGKIAGKAVEIPRMLTQLAGQGFIHKYASNLGKDNTPNGKALWEGVKGAGGGAVEAGALMALGYAGSKVGKAIETASKSELAGIGAEATTNAVGFAGYDLAGQMMSGNPIDWNSVYTSGELGAVFSIDKLAKFVGNRAIGNFLTSSPASRDVASNMTMTPQEGRDKAFDIREQAKTEPDIQKRATQEMAANAIDHLVDIKVMSDEVKKDPDSFTNAVEKTDLPKEQKDIMVNTIEDTAYPFQLGKEQFKTKEELFDYLDKKGLDKDGNINRDLFDYKEDLWPEPQTIKAINEWRDSKKGQPKGEPTPQEQLGEDTNTTFIGSMGEEGNMLDQYNVTTPDGKEATFSVPQGATREDIAQKRDEILTKFGGQDNAISRGESTQESSEQAPGLEQGEEERIHLRDNAQARVEASAGEEITSVAPKVYAGNKSLSEIGTVDEYNRYVNSVFPNSKIKGVVYHRTDTNFTDFDKAKTRSGAFYFTTKGEGGETKRTLPVVLDIKNPIITATNFTANVSNPHGEYNFTEGAIRDVGADAVIGVDQFNDLISVDKDANLVFDADKVAERTKELTQKGIDPSHIEEIVVFNPEQIHILGSDKDVNAFAQYKQGNTLSGIKAPESTENIPERVQNEANQPLSTPSGTEIPPTGEVPPEAPKQGGNEEKVRTILRRAMDSNLPDDVKKELEEKGINYVPRGRKVTDAEAQELVKVFEGDPDGLDKLQAEVFNTSNGMLPDTRTALNSIVAERLAGQLEGVTEAKDRAIIRDKLTNSLIFEAEQGTIGGQNVESKKRWGKLLGSTPELLVASVREKLDREHRAYFADKTTEVEFAKKLMDEYVNTQEFKDKIQKGVGDEIDKIGTKNWGAESKKKIDDFFTGLLIDPKQQNLYGGLLGIPVAMYNGAMLTIKNALLLGVDIATAIQRGVEYLDKEHKDKYDKGLIDSPDWNKDGYIADTKERLKPLLERLPKAEKGAGKAKEKKPRKEKTPPTQEEIVNKLFEKMAKFATRKQVGDFVMKYLQELSDKGVVTDPRFREILSRALGRDYLPEKTEAQLTDAARTLNTANKRVEDVEKSILTYQDEYNNNPQSDKLPELKDAINKAHKAAKKALFTAQKANRTIQDVLGDKPDFLGRMGTLIQGGLLIPTSHVANVGGNIAFLPASAPAYLIAGGMDAIYSGSLRLIRTIAKNIDPVKHPDIYHLVQSLPTGERTILPFAYMRGYLEYGPQGLWEGIKQIPTGGLSRDLGKLDVQRGINPIKSFKNIPHSKNLGDLVANIIEALPAGYLAEANFRLLNLGDKLFRAGAEGGRPSEIFGLNYRKKVAEAKDITNPAERDKRIQYLKDNKKILRKQFIRNPDSESLTQARNQGDIATFAQSSALSRAIESATQALVGKKDNTAKTISSTLLRLLKITNLPYVKVPINLTTLSIEMSCPPVNAAKFIYHMSQDYKGVEGAHRAAMEDIGKLVMSSIFTGAVMSLAANGLITTLSDDKDVRAAQIKAGIEEGRLNISGIRRWINGGDPSWQEGDKSWSIKRLGIVAVQMMAIAQAYKDKSPEEIKEMREGGMFDHFLTKLYETNIGMAQYVPKMALQQSILQGTNTLMQAALGGEAEKDRWLVSQSQVLSTLLYPNTVAAISQTADPQRLIRETRDISVDKGKIGRHIVNTFKDRLFMGSQLPAKVDIWGEPIRRIPEGESWTYNLFGITKEKKYQKYSFGTHLLELYSQYNETNPDEAKNIIPTLPSPATKVGWEDSKMTPKEFEQYQTIVGRTRAQDAEAYVNSKEWEEANIPDRVTELTSIYSHARREAEAQMFSWLDYKDSEVIPNAKQNWDLLLKNDAIPLPSMGTKVEDKKMTPQEIKQLNETALSFYAQSAVPFLSGLKEEDITKLKGIKDEQTDKSEYYIQLNAMWHEALENAKSIIYPVIGENKSK